MHRKSAAAELRGQIEAVRDDCSHLKARKSSLEDILSHRAYSTEPVKRLFGAMDSGDFRPLGLLADFVEVDPAYERAAEEFLHDELEYVVVEDWSHAEQGMNLLRDGSDGRATFLVHGGAGIQPANTDPIAGPAAPHRLSAPHQRSGRSRARPAAAPGKLPHRSRSRRSTAAGGGESEFLFSAARRLVLSRPHALGRQEDRQRPSCNEARTPRAGRNAGGARKPARRAGGTPADALDREIGGLESELERLRTLQQASEKDSLALDHEMRKLTEETARSNSRISVARLDLERLRRETERSLQQRDLNRDSVAEKETLRVSRDQELTAQTEEMETLEADAAHLAEEHAALRVELAGLEERHRAERASMARVEAQLAEVTGRREELTRETERLSIERARLLADNIELDRKSADLAGQTQSAEADVNRLAFEETQLRELLAETDEKLKALRSEVEIGAPEALRDRSRPGEEAGGAEIPRRDQPEGAEYSPSPN